MTSGYIDDSPRGYLLLTFLLLDARKVQIIDEKYGRHSISFEVVGTTLDINGDIHDSGRMQQDINLNDDEISWIKKHGIRCSLAIPSKAPGNYYVRVAVRDKTSGKIGSAYRFIEIPDLNKGALALSSIFTANPVESASTNKPGGAGNFQIYHAGETLNCTVFVYNAKGAKPELESQFVMFRNEDEVYRSEPEPIDLNNVGNVRKILLTKSIHLKKTLESGNYILQLIVKDKQAGKNGALATQTLDLEILAN